MSESSNPEVLFASDHCNKPSRSAADTSSAKREKKPASMTDFFVARNPSCPIQQAAEMARRERDRSYWERIRQREEQAQAEKHKRDLQRDAERKRKERARKAATCCQG